MTEVFVVRGIELDEVHCTTLYHNLIAYRTELEAQLYLLGRKYGATLVGSKFVDFDVERVAVGS